jgi:hypothetical protein
MRALFIGRRLRSTDICLSLRSHALSAQVRRGVSVRLQRRCTDRYHGIRRVIVHRKNSLTPLTATSRYAALISYR